MSIHIWKQINDSKQIYLLLSQVDTLLNVYEFTLFWPGLKQFLVLAAYFCPIAVVICASQPACVVVQWSRRRTAENYYLDIWLLELLFWWISSLIWLLWVFIIIITCIDACQGSICFCVYMYVWQSKWWSWKEDAWAGISIKKGRGCSAAALVFGVLIAIEMFRCVWLLVAGHVPSHPSTWSCHCWTAVLWGYRMVFCIPSEEGMWKGDDNWVVGSGICYQIKTTWVRITRLFLNGWSSICFTW